MTKRRNQKMTKEKLWEEWGDPSGWCEYMERGYPLSETKKDFFKDLDDWYIDKQQRELEETKAKLVEHIERLEKEELKKAWEMDPKDMQEQIQKQLKNLKSIKM